MKKRVVCVIFALILIFAAQFTAFAEYIHGFFRYTVDDGSVTITSYRGTETEVTVPSMIGGCPVNVIAKGAFADNENVRTVRLPDTVTKVENGAFGKDQTVIYAAGLKGDVSGDNKVNNKDVIALFRLISDGAEADKTVCDFNDDGKVNNKDVVSIFRSVSEM